MKIPTATVLTLALREEQILTVLGKRELNGSEIIAASATLRGSLYTMLQRMEGKKLVKSKGEKRARNYRATPLGLKILNGWKKYRKVAQVKGKARG